ncbi:hypothetical protein [Brachybacterium kimchii]|uniref:Uncharacterized protein n=1 Tax=Brachybacterium kimchii TaxID=2942909 RepID=A0ABY4N7Y6_9MICO|nr:hypothetical protein [Brachybacterium kimchii]UQN30673.1 hypothetical protein M4486_05050 [Brachybacterium kimchii]
MDNDPLEKALEDGIRTGHAALLRGLADMMRAISDDAMFPTPQFATDTSARGISRAWADLLDGSADQMEQEVSP